MDNYFMSFKLTNFFGSRVERLENEDGDVEECVVIPLKRNGLKVSEANNAVYVNAFVTAKSMKHDKKTHYITQYCVKDHLANLRELGYESPRLGYMESSTFKPTFQGETSSNNRVKLEW